MTTRRSSSSRSCLPMSPAWSSWTSSSPSPRRNSPTSRHWINRTWIMFVKRREKTKRTSRSPGLSTEYPLSTAWRVVMPPSPRFPTPECQRSSGMVRNSPNREFPSNRQRPFGVMTANTLRLLYLHPHWQKTRPTYKEHQRKYHILRKTRRSLCSPVRSRL